MAGSFKEAVPQNLLKDEARKTDIYHVVGLTYGVKAALDICQREAQLLEVEQEIPFDFTEQVAQALEFLARYTKWRELGNLLTHEQRKHLLVSVYVGQNPSDHLNEFRYEWEPEYKDGIYQG